MYIIKSVFRLDKNDNLYSEFTIQIFPNITLYYENCIVAHPKYRDMASAELFASFHIQYYDDMTLGQYSDYILRF